MQTIEEFKAEILRDPEEVGDRRFAAKLGITYEELKQLSYKEEKQFVTMPKGNQSLAAFRITFDETVRPEVVEKIKGNGFPNPFSINEAVYSSFYEPLIPEFWDDIFEGIEEFNDFIAELNGINALLWKSDSWNLDTDEKQIFYRQIYIGAFSTLETCLCDSILTLVNTNEQFKINFSRTHPKMQKEKISLSQFYGYEEKVEYKIIECIKETIFHNFWVVKKMYEGTTEIQFPSVERLITFLPKRHDLVHRNGKTKNGTKHVLELKELFELLEEVRMFIIRLLVKTNLFNIENLQQNFSYLPK